MYGYQGIREGGINWEIRIDMYTVLLIYTKQITNKDVQYNTGGASRVVLVVKNLPANAGEARDMGSIPGSGRPPGGGHDNPLQYSCLGNPMDRRAWWLIVHGVAKNRTRLKQFSMRELLQQQGGRTNNDLLCLLACSQ